MLAGTDLVLYLLKAIISGQSFKEIILLLIYIAW